MITTYNTSAPNKPTNLTVNSDLLRIAKALKINVSTTLEQALADKVRDQHILPIKVNMSYLSRSTYPTNQLT